MFIIFLSTGILYFIMGLKFLGIFQIIIYTGAIMVLFIVAMNTIPVSKDENIKNKKNIFNMIFPPLIGLSFIFFLYFLIKKRFTNIPYSNIPYISFSDISKTLFNDYYIQIEIISLMLFVAIVIVYSLIREEKDEL